MSPFEYLIPFISVLVGLAVTDLAVSLHRLLRARRRVEWDWLPLATALLATVLVLDVWWGMWGFSEAQGSQAWTLAEFLPIAAALVVLFLLNAAALPDDVPDEGVDLKAFYESNSAYFWSLLLVYILIATGINVGTRFTSGAVAWENLLSILLNFLPNVILIGLYLALVFVRTRWFHAVATVGILVFLIYQWFDRSIGAV